MERKNIIAGVLLVVVSLILGAYLESQLGAGLLWKTSSQHNFWKIAHIHGLGFGMLNIFYGLLLKNYSGNKKIFNAGSYFAVLGIIMPAGLFLAGIQSDFKMIVPVGGISMIIAWLVFVWGFFVKKI
ncbi:MAG: hypothetical protein OEV78_00345 [Spirochaetia bacterium]|nr:hypothetical protein [Spirochaetia bacterium]